MIKFLVTQIRLGKITLDQIRDNPNTSTYYDAVKAALEEV